jgi:phosphoglycerol transferase MdoB-like AlkP superfamily enzyme
MRPLLSLALFAACALILALLAWTWDRDVIDVAWGAYATPQKLFLNVFPGLLVALLLVAITRRTLLSFLLIALVYFLLYYIGRIKLETLQDPIGLQDFFFLSTIDASSFELFWGYVRQPWLCVAIAVVAIAFIAAIWRLEPPSMRRLGAARLLAFALPLALFPLLSAAKWPWDRLYTTEGLMPSRYGGMSTILHGGQVSGLVYAHLRSKKIVHAIDQKSLAWLLDHAPARAKAPAVPDQKPDVVIVLSESFFDPRVLKGMQALPDTIPNVRAAIESGHGGYMRVPTFGGGTIRTEFEILTGMPIRAFPEAQFPYTSLVRHHIPGIVRLLKSDGYRAVAVHGNAGSFWNRNNAFKAIGFDRFITQREFPKDAERNGNWISDKAMTDIVVKELEDEPGPTLVFAISMEAHGPYTARAFSHSAERDAIQVPDGLDAGQALILRNYLYHQRDADREFGRLLQFLQQRNKPAVVLFFGDHLPGFPSILNKLGTIDKRPVTKQYVPWVLLRTDMPDLHLSGYRESWMLPGEIAELANAPGDAYFALTQRLSQAAAGNPSYLQGKVGDGLYAAAAARLAGSFEARSRTHDGATANKHR